MEYEEVTWDRKETILADHGETIIKRIPINPTIMAQFVSERVMDGHKSQEIQDERPRERKNALIQHLQEATVEVFLSFCIVLEEKQGRRDIVHKQFGLTLQHLKHQRDAIREENRRANAASEASAGSTASAPNAASAASVDSLVNKVPVVQQPTDCIDPKKGPHGATGTDSDEVDVTATTPRPSDMPAANSDVPPPSRTLVPDDIESLTQDLGSVQVKECKMLHDPTEQKELHITELKPNWNAEELERLRKSFSDKPHKPVVIALLDTGVNTSHPDLQKSKMIEVSSNFVGDYKAGLFYPLLNEDKDLTHDKANHGTMSAGILWQCATEQHVKILNLKVVNSDGDGHLRYVTEALGYIKQWDKAHKDMPVDIVLMTLGSPQNNGGTNKLLAELGEYKILVCSASNEGQTKANSVLSPANHGSVIAIGSCDRLGNRCSHSSVGQELDFLFPGENIQSTSSHYNPLKLNSRYVEKSGTSFAAPYAAALMALVLCYVETHITQLNGKDGAYWRKAMTKSAEMKCLLRDVCCRREHEKEKGFGALEMKRISKDGILAYLKLQFNIPD